MKGAFWILTLGAIVSALMAATLTRAADLSGSAEAEVEADGGGEAAR